MKGPTMTKSLRSLPFALLLCVAPARSEVTQAFVAQFYPAALTMTAAGPVSAARRQTVFTVGSLTKEGSPIVVAVFTNGIKAVVSVISPAGDGAVLSTVAPDTMGGRTAEIALIDFDGNGNKLIVVTLDQYRGLPGAWIFKWTGSALQNVSPVNGVDDDDSDLSDPTFLDIDGSGHVSIIAHEAGTSADDDGTMTTHERLRVYRYVNGAFERTGFDADYFGTFARGKGAPVAQTAAFDVADPARGRDVIIVNGGSLVGSHDNGQGSTRVSSAEISVNGQSIAKPEDFTGKTSVLRATTQLKDHNQISVKVNGGPESVLHVLIMPKP